jgi:hypothetical protein
VAAVGLVVVAECFQHHHLVSAAVPVVEAVAEAVAVVEAVAAGLVVVAVVLVGHLDY